MECKDGYDGPNYWELFAQFYYSGITVPPYCRQYARPNHPFKTPGMICLSEDGEWRNNKMFKLIVLLAAIIVITTQWGAFTDIIDVSKALEVTSEIITKVKE